MCSFRLYKPQCDLDPSWEEEELLAATSRTVSLLHEATVKPKQKEQEEDGPEDGDATQKQKATPVQQEATPDTAPETREAETEDEEATLGKQDITLEDLEVNSRH